MKTFVHNDFVCPVDGLALLQKDRSLTCAKKHVYDLAREGYCNLLLVQQKATLDPGDSKEMVSARRRFLDGGYFAPIADKLFKRISEIASKKKDTPLRIVDAGCGEGYYLDHLEKLAKKDKNSAAIALAGFDISKWAIKSAAKRSNAIAWAVASNKQLPFAPRSVDIILSTFGFPIWESFKAVQPAGGRVLLVEPGAEHLIELRKIIYPNVNDAVSTSFKVAQAAGYELTSESPHKFPITLSNNPRIQDLLSMTPHAFKVDQARRENLKTLDQFVVTVDVTFRELRLVR